MPTTSAINDDHDEDRDEHQDLPTTRKAALPPTPPFHAPIMACCRPRGFSRRTPAGEGDYVLAA